VVDRRPGYPGGASWSMEGIPEVDAEDAFYAFKHVYLARNPGAEFRKCDYDAFRKAPASSRRSISRTAWR
jgi:hypothetical protein